MSAFEILNKASIPKEYKNFSDLPIGEYSISKFELYKTKLGIRLKVTLGDIFVFLPERYSDGMTDDDVQLLNETKMLLKFAGKDAQTNWLDTSIHSFNSFRHNIVFEILIPNMIFHRLNLTIERAKASFEKNHLS